MRHVLIALSVGVATIFLSVLFLGNKNNSYHADSEQDREIVLNETYSGVNYDFKPTLLECDEYQSNDNRSNKEGCVLTVELTNTSEFEQMINLGNIKAVEVDGTEFTSSRENSQRYVSENELVGEIDADEQVEGGIFFEAPADAEISEIEILESATKEPIRLNIENKNPR